MMDNLSFLLPLAAIHTVALISPGPDFALVVQNASRHGRGIGLAIALGISLAILLHTTLSLTGVSILIQQHPILPNLLKFAGGSYLIWLGIGALRNLRNYQQTDTPIKQQVLATRRQALLRGFTTNLINPKALVFFISLVSGLVPAATALNGKLLAALLLWALSFGWFALLAWLLTGKGIQQRLHNWTPIIDGVCGGLFCLLGSSMIYNGFIN